MANRVFEDRLGVWISSPRSLPDRLPALRRLGIVDVFLPGSVTPEVLDYVAARGLYPHLWRARDGLGARDYAQRVLLDVQVLGPRGCELNIEGLSDVRLPGYIREVVGLIRSVRPRLRLRLNLPPWKGFALPIDLLKSDPVLYVSVQNYEGNMDNLLSPADVLADLRRRGAPDGKLTVCYAAACRVLGSAERVRTLPDLSRLRRGLIFSDDLLAEAGLL
jgi:hypothetical protein